jgi:hypothetical protein
MRVLKDPYGEPSGASSLVVFSRDMTGTGHGPDSPFPLPCNSK